jgi:hypothetical protein
MEVDMLSQAVIDDVVKKLNDATDIPFVGEPREAKWIATLVGLIDQHLPPWVVQFMASAADGLTDDELKVHENVIVADLCKRINLSKLLPDFIEEKLIRYAVQGVLAYAKVGNEKP